MATRIIAIPDQDGIIRIACGSDLLEILVASRAPSELEAEKESMPEGVPEPERRGRPKPKIRPIPPSVKPIPMWVRPYAMLYDTVTMEMVVDLEQGSETTIAQIVQEVKDEQQAPNRPDPDMVLLQAQNSADIHALIRLASRMNQSIPDVMLGIAFDGHG